METIRSLVGTLDLLAKNRQGNKQSNRPVFRRRARARVIWSVSCKR
jgi:hypothetical protein